MKYALAFALIAATPAVAQDFGMAGRSYTVDLGIGAAVGPEYPGSDEGEVSPWIIWRNSGFGNSVGGSAQGLSFAPSFGTVGDRDTGDYPELSGLDDIDRAYELGLRVSYGMGPVTAFGSLRRGFDGHEGLTGEIGAKYRTQLTERLTLWSGAELVYGDDEFNNTYFGVTATESAASGLDETQPGGGLNEAALTFEAKYAMTETTSLLGEIRYGKLIGDAADSPMVQEEYQPSLRLGVTRRFTFGF